MNVGFFGTPEIASYCLEKLATVHNIKFVVTGEDKSSGRNRKINFSPVKQLALNLGVDIYQPSSLKGNKFYEDIIGYEVDIFVVVAYGKIIPRNIFDIPRLKTINLHPSLLPLYRGAAPIEWAIVDGNSESGITVQLINEKLDAGDIVLQNKIALNESMTSGELYDLVLPMGSDMLLESIELLNSGEYEPQIQDDSMATYCSKIDMDIARIDWSKSSKAIHDLVRGFNPKPVAWSEFRESRMKIWETALFTENIDINLPFGTIYKITKKRLLISTGDGFVELMSIQPQGKKRMDTISFINGYRIDELERFI